MSLITSRLEKRSEGRVKETKDIGEIEKKGKEERQEGRKRGERKRKRNKN